MEGMATPLDLAQLELAVTYALGSQCPNADLHQQAISFCDQVKQLPDGWRHGLHLWLSSSRDEAKFFGLQLLAEYLGGRPGPEVMRLTEPERDELRVTLLKLLEGEVVNGGNTSYRLDINAESSFLKTKLAVVITLLVKADYLGRWPTAFVDLRTLAQRSPTIRDLYLRVLDRVEEEVVEFREAKTTQELARCTMIKDQMRATGCTAQITDFCYTTLITYADQLPELAESSLKTFSKFIAWIDIGLVVNDRVLPMFFNFLQHQQKGLRVQACHCILQIVKKGMDEMQKIELIHRLQLLDIVQRLSLEDEDFAQSLGELINEVGHHLLEAFDPLEAEVVKGQASEQSLGLLALTSAMLNQLLPVAFACFEHEDSDVSRTVTELFRRLCQTLRRQLQNPRDGRVFNVLDHVPRLLNLVYRQMQYPTDFDFEAADEDEGYEEEYREEVRKIYGSSLCRLCPQLSLSFLCEVWSTLFNQQPLPTLPFPVAEAALRLVYHFADGCKGDQLSSGPFMELLIALHQSNVAEHPHPQVVMRYLDVTNRYLSLLQKNPQCIPHVMEAYCGPSGLQNPRHSMLRTRSAFLLTKAVKDKGLKDALKPYAATIVTGIAGLVARGQESSGLSDDAMDNLYEASGYLIASSADQGADGSSILRELLNPALACLMAVNPEVVRQSDPEVLGKRLAASVSAVAHTSMAFSRTSWTSIKAIFQEAFQISASTFAHLPSHLLFRSRIVMLLHRSMAVLETEALPLLDAPVKLLCATCNEVRDLQDLVALVNLIGRSLKEAAADLVNELVMPLLSKSVELAPKLCAESDAVAPHEATERATCQKQYYILLQHLTGAGLAGVLLSPTNSPHLVQILTSLLQGATEPGEAEIRKTCFATLTRLASDWCTPGPTLQPHVLNFFTEQVLPAAVRYPVTPLANPNDAESLSVLNEVAALLTAMRKAQGQALVGFVVGTLLPSLNCPADLASQMEAALTSGSSSQIREVVVSLARRALSGS